MLLFLLPLPFVLFQTNVLVFPDTQIYKLCIFYIFMYPHVPIKTLFILQAACFRVSSQNLTM